MEAFLADPEAVVMNGRLLLYPRFFSRDTGISSATPSGGIRPARDFPRARASSSSTSPDTGAFPHASSLDSAGREVLLLGCQREGYVEARLVAFPEQDSAYISESFTLPMPLMPANPELAARLLTWYEANGRTLPWRGHRTPTPCGSRRSCASELAC